MTHLIEAFTTINHWWWLGVALILMISELLGCAGFLFWLGLSALLTALLTGVFKIDHWQATFVIFAIGSIICSVAWWRYLNVHPSKTDKPHLNRRAAALVGRRFELETPIQQGVGHLKMSDTRWRIEGLDCAAGTCVEIVAVKGSVLNVKLIEVSIKE